MRRSVWKKLCSILVLAQALLSCSLTPVNKPATVYDTVIRHGTVYDGSGTAPISTDIAVIGDRIAAIGDLGKVKSRREVNASGLAVAPGFINMLSWSNESLIRDGRAISAIKQGVTLEVMGEGWSWGPVPEDNPKHFLSKTPEQIDYAISWRTLGEYLTFLEGKGVSLNVASFVGASTVRMLELGLNDAPPSTGQLYRMKETVRTAMREGAMGVGAALVYVPGSFAQTEELIALASIAQEYDGMFTAHIRSEGNSLIEAVDEILQIANDTGVRAEIHHLKATGRRNWHKMEQVIEMVEQARKRGLAVTANMYTYPASGTSLDALLPLWARKSGFNKMRERLQNNGVRRRVINELSTAHNSNLINIGADNILLVDIKGDAVKQYAGMRLSRVARQRETSDAEALVDLLMESDGPIFAIFFSMSEENLARQVALPWVSFCNDAPATSIENRNGNSTTHPREFGAFARLFAKYVREEQRISMQEAVRRLTSLPAENLKIRDRGRIRKGYYADIVIFDPEEIRDYATFENPRRYAGGVVDVFVNGVKVLSDGEHTGALPGRFVRGPGWRKDKASVKE